MKTLALLRHAKSASARPGQSDFDRSLNDRGRRDARTTGAYIRKFGFAPDVVLCSPASRTRETWKIIRSYDAGAPIVSKPEVLYLPTADVLFAELRKTPENAQSVLLIGHNPSLHQLALSLADAEKSDRGALAGAAAKFPTATLALFELRCKNWREMRPGCGALTTFFVPREDAKSP